MTEADKLAICVILLDGPAKGQVVENVPLNIETAEYSLVPKYVLRYHHYSMDGRYLSTEDAPPYDDDHEKCRYRDEVVELTKEVERLRADVSRYRATLQKVAERSLAIPGVREVITSIGEGLSSDG